MADGLRHIKNQAPQNNAIYFIDPPYCHVGKRLYRYGEFNHGKLFQYAARLNGDFLMTYNNAEEIQGLAHKYGFQTRSIFMNGGSNNQKTELLIGRNLNWIPRPLDESDSSPQLCADHRPNATHSRLSR